MKFAMKLMLAVVVLVGIAVVSQAIPKSSSSAPMGDPQEVEGTVASIVLEPTPTLMLRLPEQDEKTGQEKTISLTLDPKETVVLIGGKPNSLDTVVTGQRVKAIFRPRNDQNRVASIVVLSPVISFAPEPESATPSARPEPGKLE